MALSTLAATFLQTNDWIGKNTFVIIPTIVFVYKLNIFKIMQDPMKALSEALWASIWANIYCSPEFLFVWFCPHHLRFIFPLSILLSCCYHKYRQFKGHPAEHPMFDKKFLI